MDNQPNIHRIYDEIAERYAEAVKTKPHNRYLERPAIRALVPSMQAARVLDAGCGSGTNIQWLVENGAIEVVGIDASPQMIEIARRETDSRVRLFVADLNHPLNALASDGFDLVFSSLVVHYIADLDALFWEFARLLHPGGSLIFSTHHPQNDYHYHSGDYFETVLISEKWRGFADKPVEVSFYRRPLSAITEALARAGFVIERLTEAQPTEEYSRADPSGYEKALQLPTFLCVRARLV